MIHSHQPLQASAASVHLVVVPHTHWDREWYQPYQEFRGRLVRLIDRLIEGLEDDPAFAHFHLDGQTIVVEDYLEIRPQRRAALRRLIRARRIGIGPWYVLPDEFLVSGESLIRNLQIGHRLAAAFSQPVKVGYLPDEFGHTAQMPQILAGFGIDCAVVWRGVGPDVTQTLFTWAGLDGTTILTVYLPVSGYSNGRNLLATPEQLRAHLEAIIAEQATYRRIPSLLVLNGTDHQEPQTGLAAALSAAVHRLDGVTYEIGPLARFIERARAEHGDLETHCGELRSPLRANVTPGVTSVRVRQKQRDFQNVSRLEHYAEPLATWHDLLGGAPQLGDFVDWAWKLSVQNHPHDSITGCSVDQVHRDMEHRFDQVAMVTAQVTTQALAALSQRLDTSQAEPGTPLLVYNPNGAGPHIVTTDLNLDAATYVVCDRSGHEYPLYVEAAQSEVLLDAELPPAEVRPHVMGIQGREYLGLVINDIRWERREATLFVSVTLDRMVRGRLDIAKLRAQWLAQLDDPTLRSVAVRAQSGAPARSTFRALLTGHGFTVFAVRRGTPPPSPPFRATEREVENEYFRVEVREDGSVSITDKQTGLWLPRCNWFVDEGDRGDEYNFDPLQNGHEVAAPSAPPLVTVAADNPVVATLTIAQAYALPHGLEADRETRAHQHVAVPITSRLRLYSGVKRIDFETTLENAAADHRLRVHFRTPLAVGSAFMEQPFGTVERSLTLEAPSDFEHPIGTVPQKTFTCLQDGTHGVALFNRGVPEVEVRPTSDGTEIALTLLRAVGWLSRGDLRYRHGPAGPGLETPEAQSLGPHRFEYALSTFTGNWEEAGIVAQAHAYAYPPLVTTTDAHPGTLASDAALVHCDNPHIVLSALVASKRRGAFVARWYNSSASTQAANITVPLATRIRAVNLLEAPSRARLRRAGAHHWRLQFRPFEIVSVQVMVAPGK